jgi:hypothetical protein
MSLFVSPTFALLYVDSVDLDLGECYFFDNDTTPKQFVLSTIMGESEVPVDVGSLHIYGGGWDYTFEGKIVVTPSDLFYDASSGGKADGWFTNGSTAGTAMMSIVATTLTEKSTSTEIINPTTDPDGVVLLTALMNDDDGYWNLWETGTYEDSFIGDTQYAIQTGELVDGSLLRMLDFRARWDLGECSPENITAFNKDLYSGVPSLQLIPHDVPEPATMLLLGLGGLILRRKK